MEKPSKTDQAWFKSYIEQKDKKEKKKEVQAEEKQEEEQLEVVPEKKILSKRNQEFKARKELLQAEREE